MVFLIYFYSNHFKLITNVHRMSVSNNVFDPQTFYLQITIFLFGSLVLIFFIVHFEPLS